MACITGKADAFGLTWRKAYAGLLTAGTALIDLIEATLLCCN